MKHFCTLDLGAASMRDLTQYILRGTFIDVISNLARTPEQELGEGRLF